MEPLILDRPALACLGLHRCTLHEEEAELLKPGPDDTERPRPVCFSAWLGPTVCCGLVTLDGTGAARVRGAWEGGLTGRFELDPEETDATLSNGALQLRVRLDTAARRILGRVEGFTPDSRWMPGPWVDLAAY